MVLVVIDEAQNLSPAALEELRMLSNLETEKSKLLQIILIGQPNLREQLNTTQLEQLRQRITVSYHLRPLDAEDTRRYINHRLRHAALGAPLEFPRDVTDLVHARSRGIPRIINVICDAVLVFGYAEERHHVDRSLAEEALKELEVTGVLPSASAAEAQVASASASVDAPMPAVPAVRLAVAPGVGSGTPAHVAELSAREEAIARREQLLQQRERELAEQRRVLSEEYRLLRRPASAVQVSAPPAAPALPATVVPSARTTPLPLTQRATAPPPPYVATTGRSPARAGSAHARETFWNRLRRLFLGLAEV
jgi:hypothetical protein